MIHQDIGSVQSDKPLVKFLLVRHGETPWNREKRFQGQQDIELNAKGRKQAEVVRDFLQSQSLSIDYAFTSPLKRAKETALIILRNQLVPLEVLPELTEMHLGEWECKLESEIKEEFAQWQRNPLVLKPGETLYEVRERVIPVWENLIKNCTVKTSNTVLVVAHKFINQILLTQICGLSLDHFWDFSPQNCSVSIIEYPQGYQGVVRVRAVNFDPNSSVSVTSIAA